MRSTIPLIVFLTCVTAFGEIKVGYELQSTAPGLSHGLQAELVWPYVEAGLKLSYGAKGFYEIASTTAPGFPGEKVMSEEVRSRDAKAISVELPIHIKYHRWPYLVGRFAYERILSMDKVESSGTSGFSKANDFSIAYGVGYEYDFKYFGLYCEIVNRHLISETDKTRYYRSSSPVAGKTYRFQTNSTLSDMDFAWSLGINHAFGLGWK